MASHVYITARVILCSCVFLCLSVCLPRVAGIATARRNILFLMVDQMDGRILDDESPQFKPPMPNIRKLMSHATNFRSSYTSAPQCVPARASMMTGRHTSDIKVWNNHVGIVSVNGQKENTDDFCKLYLRGLCASFAQNQTTNGTFVDVLDDAGYNVTLFGKLHVGAGLMNRYQGTSTGKAFRAMGDVKAAKEFSRASGVVSRHFAPWRDNPSDNETQAVPDSDIATTNSCSELLRGGLFWSPMPQFLYCSLNLPHGTIKSNSTYMNQVPDLGQWSIPHWIPKDKLHPADAYSMMTRRIAWTIDSSDPALVSHFRRVYFSMCVMADELIGRVLDSLESGGSRHEPYIIFLADHGEHNLENRQAGKHSMREASSRIPLVIAGPGIPKGNTEAQPASLHDVYPTIIDMAGAQARPGPLAGESLLPVAQGSPRKKQHIISQYHSLISSTGTFMIRKGDWKLISYAAQRSGTTAWEPQLFNITADPWEWHNLANAYPQHVEHLHAIIAKEVDMPTTDALKKTLDLQMFIKFWYEPHVNLNAWPQAMMEVYEGFNITLDCPKIEAWLGKPCPMDTSAELSTLVQTAPRCILHDGCNIPRRATY